MYPVPALHSVNLESTKRRPRVTFSSLIARYRQNFCSAAYIAFVVAIAVPIFQALKFWVRLYFEDFPSIDVERDLSNYLGRIGCETAVMCWIVFLARLVSANDTAIELIKQLLIAAGPGVMLRLTSAGGYFGTSFWKYGMFIAGLATIPIIVQLAISMRSGSKAEA